MKESKGNKKKRALAILAILRREYPDSHTALDFVNPLQCLIATILSAQCTDIQVNKVTPRLFRKYPSVQAFAQSTLEELEKDIHSTGFYKNKAKSITRATQTIIEKFNGRVPDTMEELLTLGGVGRKTANCVLGNAYGKPAITVDTHVIRLSNRIGLTFETDPDKIEMDIKALFPESDWLFTSHALIDHGRKTCTARKPSCNTCVIHMMCPRIGVTS